MKRLLCLLALSILPSLASAAEKPDWAFPVMDRVQPQTPPDDGKPKSAPGSTRTYTKAQIEDTFNPPDWYPDEHPPLPNVVAKGNGTTVRACMACHLPTGTGHDESAYIAGQPSNYLIRQMAEYKSGTRKGSGSMTTIALNITDSDTKAASDYFASLPTRPWIRVVETGTVPKTYVGPGNKRLIHPDKVMEPIGTRIIEIPEEQDAVLNRNPKVGFVAYVPTGSIAKGGDLVKTGSNGKAVACAICHGTDLKGLGEVPGIAGRTATYIVRQLFMIQDGERAGPTVALMQQVVANLSLEDMVNIAAYTASRQP